MIFSSGLRKSKTDVVSVNNVSFVNGKQIISVRARGGYSPRVSLARADMPTVLRMETKGTFDCSSALIIPSIDYRGYLPQAGITEIEISPQKSGTTLKGFCAMGMYSFQVKFN